MVDSTALCLLPSAASTGGAVVLRPDWSARRRAVVGSPAFLAAKAEEAFACALARRPAAPSERRIAVAMAAIARGVEAAGRPVPLHREPPAAGAASWQPCPFVDPAAGLAALSAQLTAISCPRAAS